MNSKIIGFLRGLLYSIVMVILAYIIQNLGGSGILPVGISTIVVGVLGMIDHALESNTGKALFGAVRS